MHRSWAFLIFTVCAAACVPKVQRIGEARVEPALTKTHFLTPDAQRLPLKRWSPPDGTPVRAVIAAVHGFNDYRNAFEEPAGFLAQRGVLTLAYDQRGFGENENAGIWAPGEVLANDLRVFLALVRAEYPGRPLYVLGDSMGGAVTLLALGGEAPAVDGVVLVAPAVWGWSTMNIFYRATLWLGAHTFRGWRFTGDGLDKQASDNMEMLRRQAEDPFVIKKTRLDVMYGLVGLMQDGLDAASDVKLPILLLYGKNDQIIPAHAIDRLKKNLRPGYDYRVYPKGYHMLLRDLGAEATLGDILRFLE